MAPLWRDCQADRVVRRREQGDYDTSAVPGRLDVDSHQPARNQPTRMDPIEAVVSHLQSAKAVAAVTGAGISAASGIPTFRGADGLWKQYRAESLATPEAFENDPALVWEWYDWRRGLIANARPNRAHEVLAAWTNHPGFTLITQNVDGLLERSGAQRVIRLHGSIWHVRCWQPCAAGGDDWRDDNVPLTTIPPRCPHCRGIVRPAVTWFGEALDHTCFDAAASAASSSDVFLTIGTSALVHPAASLLPLAKRRGAFTVEINLEPTGASDLVDVCLHGKAEDVLDRIYYRWQ